MLEPYILEDNKQVEEIIEMSKNPDFKGVFVFKHSTRCSVSHMAYKGLKSSWHFGKDMPFYYLDLIKFRDISNQLAAKFGVRHESPQMLMIKNGECVNNVSHNGVNVETIAKWIN